MARKEKRVESKLRHAKGIATRPEGRHFGEWHVTSQHVLSAAAKLTKQGNADT